ncbi:MAG: alanine dehydrogenase, partial [Planctomycetes bacterium]|nr:alanine dehydrogenase [Planctomycetota bacterium]
ANVTLLHSSPISVREQILQADLVIGAVLVQGARAPRLVKRSDLKDMKDGAVIVDVAVDQGGCIETCKPTTHADPTFVVDGVLHYCVANMPGAVPRTSTFGLTNATGPWAKRLAAMGAAAAAKDPVLGTAANVLGGACTHQGVADAFDLEYRAPGSVL